MAGQEKVREDGCIHCGCTAPYIFMMMCSMCRARSISSSWEPKASLARLENEAAERWKRRVAK